MKRSGDKYLWFCLSASFMIGIISYIIFVFRGNGALLISGDYCNQQIPFITAMNELIKDSSGGWNWNLDLGTQSLSGYSFYNLGSPFVWLMLLFPKECTPYLMFPVLVIKYMTAAVLAYYYLCIFIKNRKYAMLGSLLYSFSGYQAINVFFFHFHDVVAFFPLMMIGLEKFKRNGTKALFIFSIFINCLVNYFFFVGEVIFILIYYAVRFYSRNDKKRFFTDGLKCMLCGALGIGMAAVIFIPSAIYILGNGRHENLLILKYLSLKNIAIWFLMGLKGMLLPGEAMTAFSSIKSLDCTSQACYLPMIGISLAIAYCIRKRNWLTKLLIVLTFISCFYQTDAVFCLFMQGYKRWWYMYVLMLVLASMNVLENREEYPVRMGVWINFILIAGFCGFVVIVDKLQIARILYKEKYFLVNSGIAILGCLLTGITCSGKAARERMMAAFMTIFCAGTVFCAAYMYKIPDNPDEYMGKYQIGMDMKAYDEQYRYNLVGPMEDNVLALTGESSGIHVCSSTVSNSIMNEFDDLFDYGKQLFSMAPGKIPGLKELLGARYDVVSEAAETDDIVDVYESRGVKYYVVEKPACPIGYREDSYITENELKTLPKKQRGIVMLRNIILSDEEAEQVNGFLRHDEDFALDADEKNIPAFTQENIQKGARDFQRDAGGFTCKINMDSAGAVFFSVPHDEGWKAFANGEETQIISSGGLMSILLPEGEYDISFEYSTPGIKAGVLATLISCMVFLGVCIMERKKTAQP